MNWYNLSVKEVFKRLQTSENGILGSEAQRRVAQYGFNKLPDEGKISKFKILIHQFASPLIYILIIAGIVTILLKEYIDSAVIFPDFDSLFL